MTVSKYGKDGWRVNVYVGPALASRLPHPLTGRERLTKTFAAKRDALAQERTWESLKADLRSGEVVGGTIQNIYDAFMGMERDESTQQTYYYALRPFMESHGSDPLASWSSNRAKSFAANHPRGQVAVIRNMFQKASDSAQIETNPFREVKASTRGYKQTKQDFHSLWPLDASEQREQFSLIVRTAFDVGGPERGPHLMKKVAWAGWVGTRPAETRGFHRSDIRLSEGVAYVRGKINKIGTYSNSTKNGLHREVVIPPAPELIESFAACPTVLTLPYEFVNVDRHWTDGAFNAWWDKIRQRAGFPNMRFYDLRHFCATQLLEMGLSPEDVAVQLGHTDGGALVRSVYGHPSEDAARQRIRHITTNHFAAPSSQLRHIDGGKTA